MKKIIFLFIIMQLSLYTYAQLTLELTAPDGLYAPVELSNSGTKYIDITYGSNGYWNIDSTRQLILRNLDGTIFKTMTIPQKPNPSATVLAVFYVSESLFDMDSTTIEYMIIWDWKVTPYWHTFIQVVREDGTFLLEVPWAQTIELFTTGRYYSVYETDQGTKLELYCFNDDGSFMGSKIWSMPGQYPTGMKTNRKTSNGDITIFPNPTNGPFNIKNFMGENLNIQFYSTDGKMIKTVDVGPDMKISNLGLPAGVYLLKANDLRNRNQFVKKIIIE